MAEIFWPVFAQEFKGFIKYIVYEIIEYFMSSIL